MDISTDIDLEGITEEHLEKKVAISTRLHSEDSVFSETCGSTPVHYLRALLASFESWRRCPKGPVCPIHTKGQCHGLLIHRALPLKQKQK